MEQWRDIDGYEGYQVSDKGRVRSFRRKNMKICKSNNGSGYARISLFKDRKHHSFSVHRLVAQAFIPNPENKPQVNHIDGNTFNNCVDNLEWVTISENQSHAWVAGLTAPHDATKPYPVEFTAADIESEIWRDIAGYKGFYQASSIGRVRSLHKHTPKILRPHKNTSGYFSVPLRVDGKMKRVYIHRLVAETFIDNPENKPIINHIDGDKLNNRVSNLEWVTIAENNRHAVLNGLMKMGGDSPLAFLTNSDAEYIRNVYVPRDSEFGQMALAEKFGVHPTIIQNVVHGKTYRNAGGKISASLKRKLTAEQVREIRKLYTPKSKEFGQYGLAEKFGVSRGLIEGVLNGGLYKDVE